MTALDLEARFAWLASNAVRCPKCSARPGDPCASTGGGNYATVPTHAGRKARVVDWDNEFASEAGDLASRWQHRHGEDWPVGAFDRFEAAAAPIPAEVTKPATPKGVRLSEAQAERVEWAAHNGGHYYVSKAHFSGDATDRASVNALEAKGILRELNNDDTDRAYNRRMELTDFGWQVYRQHRLVIRRMTPAQVDTAEAEARAARVRWTAAALVVAA